MLKYTIGRGGLIAAEQKREGDGCTPLGTYPLREVWFRPDRVSRPKTALPLREITPNDCWCDDATHPLYNRHFKLSRTNPPPLEGGVRGGVVAAHAYPKERTPLAKQLRKNSTDAERKLWSRIRQSQIDGVKFRRQQPIGPYIVDFMCTEPRLIIELDGGQHNDDTHQLADKKRDSYLKSQGYHVLRFWNHDTLQNIDGVLEMIALTLTSLQAERTPPLNPLPQGEGKLPASFEHLWREDGAYDVIVVIGYNDAPATPYKGSAIFIHCMHDDGRPTAGCVAYEKQDLLKIIATLNPQSQIQISNDAVRFVE